MKRWIELTDEYCKGLKHLAKRKIRLPKTFWDNQEHWAMWHSTEKCWIWDQGESGAYMDEPDNRPTHILVG